MSGLFAISPAAGAEDSYLQQLLQTAHQQRLADRREWRLLLHIHHDILGRYRSEIDDPRFFLSPAGRRNPAAELDATLAAFFEPVSVDSETMHAQCRYPARYAWLKEQLRMDSRLAEAPCPRFEKWRAQMDPASVSLVFASYYLSNPASMYGHTFLRLNARNHTDQERLLDYTVNFAATLDADNGVLFAIKGLAGGYRGLFSTLPYYMKVQEYNNLESRDLWEYDLLLTPREQDQLVRHLWEMGSASMAYYFLNKNCSYQILPLLEVARPSLHVVDSFWFKAIPVDTLRRVIRSPGVLKAVSLRPSHVRRMLAAREDLTPVDIRTAERLARRADVETLRELQPFAANRQARILDSAYDLFRYRTGFAREQPPAAQEQERNLLVARNRLGKDDVHPSPAPSPLSEGRGTSGARGEGYGASPDQGHASGRIQTAFGMTRHSTFEEVSLRPALHDQDDLAPGYIPGSQLQMFHLKLRFDNDRHAAYAQEFTLVDIMSLSPWDRWVRKPSWNVHTGVDVASDLDRDPEHSVYYGLRGGSGLAYRSHLWRGELFYVLAAADLGVGSVFRDTYRLGGGTNSGVILDAAPWWRIHFIASYLKYPLGEPGEAVKLQLIQAVPLGKRFQFRTTLERQNPYKEVLFSLLMYL